MYVHVYRHVQCVPVPNKNGEFGTCTYMYVYETHTHTCTHLGTSPPVCSVCVCVFTCVTLYIRTYVYPRIVRYVLGSLHIHIDQFTLIALYVYLV